MNKNRKLPREGVRNDTDDVAKKIGDELALRDSDTEGHRAGASNVPKYRKTESVLQRKETDDVALRDSDTEGHRAGASNVPRMPGTGGDAIPRRPSSGGEAAEDVEGHTTAAMPRMPGTGGDEVIPRRPSTGGELTDEDDVEGHAG